MNFRHKHIFLLPGLLVLIGILILLDQSKKNHTKSNLMYLCIFMLLSISASRELAMTLNEPFQ